MDDGKVMPGPGAPATRPPCPDPVPRDPAPAGAPSGSDLEPIQPGPGPDSPIAPRIRRNLAWELDQSELSLADLELQEITARRRLDWERAKLRLRLRDRDQAAGIFPRHSEDIEAEIMIALNEGSLKGFYDTWIDLKARRTAVRAQWRILERAHRREVYGTL